MSYKEDLNKKRIRKFYSKLAFWFFCFWGVVGLFIYLLFFAGLFEVNNISVDGNETVATDDILALVQNRMNDRVLFVPQHFNIFLVKTDAIKKEIIEKYPSFKSVNIKKKFPHDLKISVSERNIVGVWCIKNTSECFYFGKAGVAFEKASDSSGPILIHIDDYRDKDIKLGEIVEDRPYLDKIIQARDELNNQLKEKTMRIVIPKDRFNEFEIITNNGWKLIFSFDLDIPFQIESLGIFFNQSLSSSDRENLEYIDARIENKFYYK